MRIIMFKLLLMLTWFLNHARNLLKYPNQTSELNLTTSQEDLKRNIMTTPWKSTLSLRRRALHHNYLFTLGNSTTKPFPSPESEDLKKYSTIWTSFNTFKTTSIKISQMVRMWPTSSQYVNKHNKLLMQNIMMVSSVTQLSLIQKQNTQRLGPMLMSEIRLL